VFLQISGVLNIEKSTCSWKHGANTLQIFSKLELFIHQKDSFGNTVPEMHPFDAQVVGTASELSIPVNLMMEAVAPGVQLISFYVVQPGEFALTVFDTQRKQRVSNTVYKFDVFVGTQLYILFSFKKKCFYSRCLIPDHGADSDMLLLSGYCNGSNSFANGSGLAHSVAGSASSFAVYLKDTYSNPSPVETSRLQLKILAKKGTAYADPIISHGNAVYSFSCLAYC